MILPHDPPTGESAALDLDLIRKYAIPGPRYTSYPPANKFHDRLSELDLAATIAADNTDPNRPLSLYFHLPFCHSRCWYCGCTTIITRRQDWATTYLAELKKEIALIASRIDLNRPVEQLHFGGGTPTFFSAVIHCGSWVRCCGIPSVLRRMPSAASRSTRAWFRRSKSKCWRIWASIEPL